MTQRALLGALILALITTPLAAAWCGECVPWDCTMESAGEPPVAVIFEAPDFETSPTEAPSESPCGHAMAQDSEGAGASLFDGSRSADKAPCTTSLAVATGDCCSVGDGTDHEALVIGPMFDWVIGGLGELARASHLVVPETGLPALPLPRAPSPQSELFTLHSVFLI